MRAENLEEWIREATWEKYPGTRWWDKLVSLKNWLGLVEVI